MSIIRDPNLELFQDTIEAVRKNVNLDDPRRIDEAVDILEEWLKKQNHFTKKEFPRIYLESSLMTAKGSLQRTKERLDKLFTYKTLMPEFFPSVGSREEFALLENNIIQAHLPKLSKEHYRVYLCNIFEVNETIVFLYYKYLILLCEYIKIHDYNNGIVYILDIRNANILNILTAVNPLALKNLFVLTLECYGLRVKRIDIISESKMVDSLVSLIKSVISAKIAQRIHTHKSIDTVHEAVGKDIMPEDYGGKEPTLKKINDKWLDTIFSKENIKFFNEMKEAKTDESRRQCAKFNEEYLGVAGSFRKLTLD